MENIVGKTFSEAFDFYTRSFLTSSERYDALELDRLAYLTKKEMQQALGERVNMTVPVNEAVKGLAASAKAVRLAGEYPYYIAKVIAVWFAVQQGEVAGYIAEKGIKAAVRCYCSIEYECELIQMIKESYTALPYLGIDSKNEEKVELMKEAYRQGDYYEKMYRGCAQCCMAAISDVTGKEDPVMFRAANGLAAGMGLLGDGACGGYSGGILSLGLFAGRRREFFDADKQEKDLCTHLVGKLHDKFIDTYGSVICHDIHKDIFGRSFHITRPEEKEAFELAGAHKLDKCPAVVGTSAAWVAEILYDEGLLTGKSK